VKNADLRVLAAEFLKREASKIEQRPHQLVFSAKHVSSSVGGYAGALGQVATLVAQDVCATAVRCTYCNNRKPAVFVIDVG
jgi:hypothetical protein